MSLDDIADCRRKFIEELRQLRDRYLEWDREKYGEDEINADYNQGQVHIDLRVPENANVFHMPIRALTKVSEICNRYDGKISLQRKDNLELSDPKKLLWLVAWARFCIGGFDARIFIDSMYGFDKMDENVRNLAKKLCIALGPYRNDDEEIRGFLEAPLVESERA